MPLTRPEKLQLALLVAPLALVLALFVWFATSHDVLPYQQFSDQSWSFLHGHLDIPAQLDTAVVEGKHYWPEGPFPSLLIMPFQLVFGERWQQSTTQVLLAGLIALLSYRLARLERFDRRDGWFLSSAFLLGSPAVGALAYPVVWYHAHVVATALLLAAVYEWRTRRRYGVLGILLSALWATRPPAGFLVFPVLFAAMREKGDRREIARNWVSLMVPLGLAALGLLWFNYARFGNVFDNGYGTNSAGSVMLPLREIGLFSWRHIPTNLYWYFLASYETVTTDSAHMVFPYVTYSFWGLSFFLVAPFFAYAFRTWREPDVETRALWLTVCAALTLDLLFCNPGYTQFGPRFTLDVLPILYLLLLESFPSHKLSTAQRNAIVASSCVNTYVLLSPYMR